MATTEAARAAEADRVEVLYQWAVAELGIAMIRDSLTLWQDTPPTFSTATSARWLGRAVQSILAHRRLAAELGLAYYRFVRALRTGYTIRDPRTDEPDNISLETLRHDFEALVDRVAPHTATNDHRPSEGPSSGSDDIAVEDVYTRQEFNDLLKNLETSAAQEASVNLSALGPKNVDKQLGNVDTDSVTGDQLDEIRATVHDLAGKRQSAAAERITMNAARGLTYSLAETDKRVIGWARYSTTGTPCGWCAMLISRGAVYKSAKTAGDMDLYHDNCHCIAIPCFSEGQFDNSPIFNLNREYKALWPKVTRGYGGKEALSIWRRYFRNQQNQQTTPPALAAA